MELRNYRPGDEAEQVAIYNEAAAAMPGFKPATVVEIRRRCQARDFDPASRFFAEVDGRVIGYASFHANGRVSYPWCRPGHEAAAEPLFAAVLGAMKARGMPKAFAAYRGDWTVPIAFLEAHGFHRAREMVNFVVDLVEMPTPPARLPTVPGPLEQADLLAVLALAPQALRVATAAELEQCWFHNPHFGPEALFVLRDRTKGVPAAVGILVEDPTYADPIMVDPTMPCFRLGAFGTERMQPKRIQGLFSFLTADTKDALPLGLTLLAHAARRLDETAATALAAQVPSDVPHLLRFYQSYFRRQGSFPVYERELA